MPIIGLKRIMGLLITGTGILAIMVMPGRAEALTFTFGCEILHPPSNACDVPGSFGTVTLTQNGPLVNIDWNLAPGFGVTLERLMLNLDTIVANRDFYLVNRATYVGNAVPTAAQRFGTVLDSNNTQTLGEFGFDVTITPIQGTFGLVSNGQAALTAFNRLDNPDTQVPLLESNFNVATVPTPTSPGLPPLFAGYRTNVNVNPPPTGEFWAGSPGTVVPEPASLLLLGTGLVALGGLAAKRRAGKKVSSVPLGL